MAFYSYLSTKIIIMTFITKSYQNLFGVRSYINAKIIVLVGSVGGANTHRLFSCFSLGLLHRLIFHFRRLIHFLLYMNDVIIPISLISKGYIVLQNTQRIVQSIRNPEFSS